MMKTNPNEPISAVLTQSSSLQNETSLGLTKREMFAALAMQGVCANSNGTDLNSIAQGSVAMADYLIEALNKEEQ